jgi:hypothetical protein
MAYYKKGLKDKAIAELDRTLKIDSSFPKAAEARQVLKELGG